jgi:hypothetical protein
MITVSLPRDNGLLIDGAPQTRQPQREVATLHRAPSTVGAHAPTQLWHDGYSLHHWARGGGGQGGAKEEEDDEEDPVEIFPAPVLPSQRRLQHHFTVQIRVGEQGQPTRTLAPSDLGQGEPRMDHP